MKRKRGFIQFLLGNPLMLLSAALGVALVVAGIGLKFYKSRAKHWHAEAEAVQARFDGFVIETARLGKEAQAKTDAKIAAQHQVNDDLGKQILKLGAYADELSRDRKRLRKSAIRRPDGSSVPTTTVRPEGPQGERQPANAYLLPSTESLKSDPPTTPGR